MKARLRLGEIGAAANDADEVRLLFDDVEVGCGCGEAAAFPPRPRLLSHGCMFAETGDQWTGIWPLGGCG